MRAVSLRIRVSMLTVSTCLWACNDADGKPTADGVEVAEVAEGAETSADAPSDTGPENDTEAGPEVETVVLPSPPVNALQLKGTHNSYHVKTASPADPLLNYEHAPLDVQLESQHVRHFELDAHVDPTGVLRVYHIPAIDPLSHCATLTECVAQLRTWSVAHPRHLPLFVLIETSDEVPAGLGCCDPGAECDTAGIGEACWDGHAAAIDDAILAAWPRASIVTPDDVRGTHATLRDAATSGGWPTVDAARGKAFFIINDGGKVRAEYRHAGNDLSGRACFTMANPADADAAFIKRDNPTCEGGVGEGCDIEDLVRSGFILRARADSDFVPDPPKWARALASGAQLLSTDIPTVEEGAGQVFEIPDADGHPVLARCNPVLVAAGVACTPDELTE